MRWLLASFRPLGLFQRGYLRDDALVDRGNKIALFFQLTMVTIDKAI
jgi:hypothetical protein